MKKLIYVSCIFLFYGCIFTYDPAPGKLNIRNNSDEAVYVYLKCGKTNILPLEPKLDLFHFISANMEDSNGDTIKPHFISPDYRINAYTYGALNIGGNKLTNAKVCPLTEVKINTSKRFTNDVAHMIKNKTTLARTMLLG